MRKTIKLLLFFLAIAYAESSAQIWNYEFDKGGEELSNSITILNNFIYINEINNNNSAVIKTDLSGNLIASKTFNNILRSSSIIKTSTNELLLLGTSTGADEDLLVFKLDENLNIIWTFKLNMPSYQYPEAGIENSNGDFTICGYTANSASSTGSRDGIVLRINASGQLLWCKKHNTSGSDYFSGITEGPSGNMTLVGAVQGGAGLIDISVTQVNNTGDIIKAFTWGGAENDGGYSVVFHNNAYYVSGNTWSAGVGMQDMVLLKLDASLNLIYAKTYGGSNIEPGLFVNKTSNGKILLAGQTLSVAGRERDICILLLEENGSIIRMKNIGTAKTEEVGYGYRFIEEFGGEYYITSSTINASNNKNILLSKIDMISKDTCCKIANNIAFISTNSNFPLTNFGFASSTINTSGIINPSTSQSTYSRNLLCKSNNTLTTNISANGIHFCANTPIQFSSTSNLFNVNYQWNFGDPASGLNNTDTTQNPIHIYAKGGEYFAYLISKADCSVDTDTVHITIKSIATLQPSISSMNINHCVNDSVSFSATGNFGDGVIQWNFGDPLSGVKNTSSLINPKHLYTTPGIYKVYFIITNLCGSDTDSVSINILDRNSINTQINTGKSIYCQRENVLFYVTNTNPDESYFWDFGDPSSGPNNTSVLINPTHQFASPGSYTIVLKTQNACASDLDTIYIQVVENKTLGTSIKNMPKIFCINESIPFNAISEDPNAIYVWDFGDPTSGTSNYSNLQNPNHTFIKLGEFLVILSSSNECNKEEDSISITIRPTSEVDFRYVIDSCSGYTEFINTSENIGLNAYSWYLNDSLYSNATDTNILFPEENNYSISLILNPNTNCSDTIQKTIHYKKPDPNSQLIIPNAFTPNDDGHNDIYEIMGSLACEFKKISVYNRWGRLIYENTETLRWDGKANGMMCAVGTYIIQIEFKNKTITKTVNLLR